MYTSDRSSTTFSPASLSVTAKNPIELNKGSSLENDQILIYNKVEMLET